MIVVASKIDVANPDKLKKLSTHAKRRKLEFHAISAVTGQGIDELKWALRSGCSRSKATLPPLYRTLNPIKPGRAPSPSGTGSGPTRSAPPD